MDFHGWMCLLNRALTFTCLTSEAMENPLAQLQWINQLYKILQLLTQTLQRVTLLLLLIGLDNAVG